ncbi:MAG: DHHA1 domain-containing protein, partial [Candidatus Woesearchaeota archaeon]
DEFIKRISCDVILIDHHQPQTITQKNVYYYNPEVEGKQKPTTAICYEIVNQNSWIAMTGTTGDWHYDKKIAKDFQKDFPDYIDAKLTKAPDILFTTKIGELVKIIAFNLKGKITEVKKSIKVFTRIESPDEILDKKTPAGTFIYKKYKKMNVLYEELKKEVLAQKNETLFLEHISTNQQVSFSSELSNEILYLCPEKVIIIGRTSGGNTKGSVRTALDIDLRPAIEESTQGIGYGGGHDKACGFCVEDEHFHIFLEKFKAKIEEIVEEK